MDSDTSSADPLTLAEDHAQCARRNRAAIEKLIEIGLDLAEELRTQIKSEVELARRLSEPAPDFSLATDRIFRTVRRTILLCEKINDRLLAPPQAARTQPANRRAAVRRQIIREVEDAIESDVPADEAETLRAEFIERLDCPDVEDDIGDRPAAEIIETIRHDLGIAAQSVKSRTWKRRTPEDVALLCKRAAAQRPAQGPFVAPMPARKWYYTDPLCPQAEARPTVWPSEPSIRGP